MIPRGGFRLEDMRDDAVTPEVLEPSAEVRERFAVYLVTIPAITRGGSALPAVRSATIS